MDTFAPEFAQYWLVGQGGEPYKPKRDPATPETPTLQAALIELAERVTAARSVV